MSYSVVIEAPAQRELRKLPVTLLNRIGAAIDSLASEPRLSGCKKLKGREAYRIRVGDYRIIYEIRDEELIVTVIDIGHRGEVYR